MVTYRYTDPTQNWKTVTHTSDDPGSVLRRIAPEIQFNDTDVVRVFKEIRTKTGVAIGRAEKLATCFGERWQAHCLFPTSENSRISAETDHLFETWESARAAILAECDRREGAARKRTEVTQCSH